MKFFYDDIIACTKNWELWVHLGWQDIKLQYRRSFIGPFWITLTMAIFISLLGTIYSKFLGTEIDEYIPSLAIGFIVWGLISGIINEACNTFINKEAVIKDGHVNLVMLVLVNVWKHIIIFLHNFFIIVAILLWFKISISVVSITFFIGLLILVSNLIFVNLILAILGTRYRDLNQIVQNFTQVLFFLSPIMWLPRLVDNDSWILDINPIAYFLDLVRSPLINVLPNAVSYLVGIGACCMTYALAVYFYNKHAQKIGLWL